MTDIIQERTQTIDKIATIMKDINQIAKEINVETNIQGEKLLNVETTMTTAADNTRAATQHLTEAANTQRKSYKWLIIMMAASLFLLIILIASI
jgi:t-SNARE complex subunit (syntaxin)